MFAESFVADISDVPAYHRWQLVYMPVIGLRISE